VKPFVFCPSCATKLGERDGEGGATCPNCGRVWYRHSAPTAGAVIVNNGRALVTVRAREPEKDRIDVPGGFLMAGEDPIDGVKREVMEELGVEIETNVSKCLTMAIHRYGEDGDFVLALGFRARLVSGDPKPTDDVADIKWVSEEELDSTDFAWPHDRELVRQALTTSSSGELQTKGDVDG
jgi:NADH pyrophosphatase NudC (nudix superfamily)